MTLTRALSSSTLAEASCYRPKITGDLVLALNDDLRGRAHVNQMQNVRRYAPDCWGEEWVRRLGKSDNVVYIYCLV